MHRHFPPIILVSALIVTWSVGIAAAPEDASAKHPLLGIWVLDSAEYTGTRQAPRSEVRTFSLGPDGTLMVTLTQVDHEGHAIFVFWQLKLGGPETGEYSSQQGAKPIRTIQMRRLDSHTTEMIVRYLKGTPLKDPSIVSAKGTFVVSGDGQRLTYSAENSTPEGLKSSKTRVYRRQP